MDHSRKRSLPRSIWALGFVSLFMDISSEMIHSLLPVFLVTALGASAVSVGFIEGVGEATASISKVFSGWLSDRLGRRKVLAVVGYGFAALSKPLFALAPTVAWVLGARVTDRLGKGIRGAPRDALVGDLAPVEQRGAAYGLRQSLDTVGAFAGPLLAVALMTLLHDDFRAIFWIALVPAIMAVIILVTAVREPRRVRSSSEAAAPIRLSDLRQLDRRYWSIVAVGAVLALARFSEAFLILRAEDVGLGLAFVPLVLVVMNIVYAFSAYPVGVLSDRVDRRGLLALGGGVLIAADVVLALAADVWVVMLGVALWGLHMGMTQGLFAVLVADAAPARLRATAFGIFHLVGGIATLLASVIAGVLWQVGGAGATFVGGAAFTAVSLLGIASIRRPRASVHPEVNP